MLDGHVLNPGDNPWTALEQLGDLVVYDRTPPDQIVERARAAHVVLTNKTPLTRDTLSQLPLLKGVAVLATGYNVVDAAGARQLGIPVCNVPVYGTEGTAQHAFALLLELTNRVGQHAAAVRDGEWVRSVDFSFWLHPVVELTGLTLGVVGYGRIGQRVAHLARAFGMRVWATRPSNPPALPDGIEYRTLPEIFASCDVVSLHCPLTPHTERLVRRDLLATMKDSALLVNTARGALIDEADLAEALRSGRIAGAALDVVTVEPMAADNPLRSAPNCLITPHIAWTSLPARRRLMAITVENVHGLIAGRPRNVVNS